jgi:hypothetical protein
MPLEDFGQYESDAGSSEQDCHSDDLLNSQSEHSNASGSSSDLEGDGSVMRKETNDNYSSEDSSSHTPAQKSKRPLHTPSPIQHKAYLVPPSDDEELEMERDELYPPRQRKIGFRRPPTGWETVAQWNRSFNNQEDIDGEIAQIMVKAMLDANFQVTLKYQAQNISIFCLKQVHISRFISTMQNSLHI